MLSPVKRYGRYANPVQYVASGMEEILGDTGQGSGPDQWTQNVFYHNVRQRTDDLERMERHRTEDYARQKEFAQEGTGWMLDDAKSRGLSAMAAMGGQSPAYKPMSSGGFSKQQSGQRMNNRGQDRGRNYEAGLQIAFNLLNLKNLSMKNKMLDKELELMDGQPDGNVPEAVLIPPEVTGYSKTHP